MTTNHLKSITSPLHCFTKSQTSFHSKKVCKFGNRFRNSELEQDRDVPVQFVSEHPRPAVSNSALKLFQRCTNMKTTMSKNTIGYHLQQQQQQIHGTRWQKQACARTSRVSPPPLFPPAALVSPHHVDIQQSSVWAYYWHAAITFV